MSPKTARICITARTLNMSSRSGPYTEGTCLVCIEVTMGCTVRNRRDWTGLVRRLHQFGYPCSRPNWVEVGSGRPEVAAASLCRASEYKLSNAAYAHTGYRYGLILNYERVKLMAEVALTLRLPRRSPDTSNLVQATMYCRGNRCCIVRQTRVRSGAEMRRGCVATKI